MRPFLERANIDVEKWDPFFDIAAAERPMMVVRMAHHWLDGIYCEQYDKVIRLWKCYKHWDWLFSHGEEFPEVKTLKRLLYQLKLALTSQARPEYFRKGKPDAITE